MPMPTKAEIEAKKLAESASQETATAEKKEELITLSESQLDSLIEKKIKAKELENSQNKPTPTPETKKFTNASVEKLSDDLPELRNWEVKDRMYVLVEPSKSVSHGIRNKHKKQSPLQYYNPDTNTTHSLRYATNQNSFFMDKQVGDVLTEHILMKGGKLQVPKEQVMLQKFLAIHPDNNKIWKEFDPRAESQKELDVEDEIFAASAQVRALSYQEQEAIARVALKHFKVTWDNAIVKKELYDWVKTNPKKAIELANDNSILIKGMIKTAIHRGLIEYKNKKFVGVDGKTILEVGYNEDEYDAIVAYTKEPDGEAFLDYIKNAVS